MLHCFANIKCAECLRFTSLKITSGIRLVACQVHRRWPRWLTVSRRLVPKVRIVTEPIDPRGSSTISPATSPPVRSCAFSIPRYAASTFFNPASSTSATVRP